MSTDIRKERILNNTEAAILRRLCNVSMTGQQLQLALQFKPHIFETITKRLWCQFYLQGHISDGCCHAPCGPHCISAYNLGRHWELTKKGHVALTQFAE